MDTFDEIHLAVKNNNISYAEIAENIGISREHLSRQLSKKELSKKNTNKILDYLKSQKIDISTEIDNHTPTSTIKTNLGVQVYDVDFSAGKKFSILELRENHYPIASLNIPELKKADTAIKNKNIRLWYFKEFIYCAAIRRTELTLIKVRDILGELLNLKLQRIQIVPTFSKLLQK